MAGFDDQNLPGDERWGGEPETAEAVAAPAVQDPPTEDEPEKPKRRGSIARLLGNSLGRALTGAVDEFSDTVVNMGADLRMGFEKARVRLSGGAYKIDEDFLSWYETGPENRNPFKIDGTDNRREEWFGEKNVDSIGWVEDILQFSAGMFAASKVLKGAQVSQQLARGGLLARTVGRIGRLDVAGAVADFGFMDPDESNVLDVIIQKAPDEQASLIQRAFASDPDDAETWNRLRAGLNGFIVGKALDRALAVLKYAAFSARAARASDPAAKELLQKKAGDALEEADKLVSEGAEQVTEDGVTATPRHVDVVPNPDGEGFVLAGRNGKPLEDSPVWKRESQAHASAAAFEEMVPRADDELVFTTKLIRDNILRAAQAGDPIDAARLADGVNFNFHYIASTEGQKAWLTAVEETLADVLNLPTITNKQLEKAAARLDMGPISEIRRQLDESADAVRQTMVKQLAARTYMAQASNYVSRVATLVERENMTNPVNLEKLRIALGTLSDLLPGIRNVSNASGQLLQSHQIAVPTSAADNVIGKAIDDATAAGTGAADVVTGTPKRAARGAARKAPASAGVFANMTEKEIMGLATRVGMTGGDERSLLRLLATEAEAAAQNVKPNSKAWEWFQRVRYNSLLSGPRTHSRNTLGNLINTVWRPIELGVNGMYKGEPARVQEAFEMMTGLWRAKSEAFAAFGKAFRAGTPILDTEMMQEAVEAMTKQQADNGTYKMFGYTLNSNAVGWLKTTLDLPSRLLMSSDEFFKNLQYRSAVFVDGMAKAREVFPDDPSKWGKYADDYVDRAFDAKGGYLSKDAMEYAREGTFTRQLADGGWASKLSNVINGTGPMKVVVPFVQTPINVFLAVSERTPGIWRLSKRMQADLKAGGLLAEQAQAKIQLGQDLWTFSAGLALAGAITGGGPKDPRLRGQMMTAGWRPYSIKIPGTDKWVSYEGMEPLGTIVGIAADVLEQAADLSRDERERDLLEVTQAFAMGVANNVTNKTFLRGLADFSNLLSGNEGAGSRWAAGLISSTIPFGSFVNQTKLDDTVREARTVADRVLGRTAWGDDTLEPMYNVFGKELKKESWVERAFLPFSLSDASDEVEERVMSKMLRDTGGAEFMRAPSGTYLGMDLKDRLKFNDRVVDGKVQSPYSRLMQLFDSGELNAMSAGVVNQSGTLPPLVEAMRAMVEQDNEALQRYFGPLAFKFAGWEEARVSEGRDISKIDTRKAMADEMVSMYRKAALTHLESEYPSIKAEAQRLRSGRTDARLNRAGRYINNLTDNLPSTQ